jgi:hypothetical protein
MASLDSLPPDQRAALQLVLQRGRSYDEIAQVLSIDRAAVRDRALNALDALGPQTDVAPPRRALIGDYLLGQLPPDESDELRDRLADSAGERAWASAVESELAPLATVALPEVSGETSAAHPRSRLGGAILLAGGAAIAAAVVTAVIVVGVGGGSTSHHQPVRASARAGSTSAAATSTPAAQPVAQINLGSPQPHSAAKGIAEVLAQGTTNEIAIVASGLTPNATHPPNAYAVWLYNSPTDSHILGFDPGVGRNGRLEAAAPLPSDAGRYRQLIVTLETQAAPRTPGRIVLEGTLTGLS